MADAPLLFLITPRVDESATFAPFLEAALDATRIACVLIRTLTRSEEQAETIIRTLTPVAQRRGAAVLVEHVRLAELLDVDGVHLNAGTGSIKQTVERMNGKITGFSAASRDAAMMAGEQGADYVMFGGPDGEAHVSPATAREMAAWWSPIFNVPCVGYVDDPNRAGDMVRAGVEFVALSGRIWSDPPQISATLREATSAILSAVETMT
jgi:thiamine-phosphate pyrophosphorylase